MKQFIRDSACGVLQSALAPRAEVRALEGTVVVTLPDGPEVKLELLAWPADDELVFAAGRGRHIWILHRVPRRVHDVLRQRGESFVDLKGEVHLELPNLYVDRNGLAVPRPRVVKSHADPFSDRGSLVLRTLFSAGTERTWGVRELADAAGVSPATVTRTVQAIERLGVLQTRRYGRSLDVRLADAPALFRAWAARYDYTRNESLAVHAPMGDPLRFLARGQEALEGRRFALTLQAGASLVAPHAAWDRAHVYVDVDRAAELIEIAGQQGWPAADDGRLVLMKPYYRDAVWHGLRTIDSLPVVSTLQLALDLWNYPLRGREQAEHLLAAGEVLA